MAEQSPASTSDFWEITNLRRLQLGKRWKDVLTETELSHETLNRWRKGLRVDPLTDQAFERALLWAPGARDAHALGREPAAIDETPSTAPPSPSRSDAMSSRELEVLANMVASAADGFGFSEVDLEVAFQQARRIVEERRRRREGRGEAPDPPRSNQAS